MSIGILVDCVLLEPQRSLDWISVEIDLVTIITTALRQGVYTVHLIEHFPPYIGCSRYKVLRCNAAPFVKRLRLLPK